MKNDGWLVVLKICPIKSLPFVMIACSETPSIHTYHYSENERNPLRVVTLIKCSSNNESERKRLVAIKY